MNQQKEDMQRRLILQLTVDADPELEACRRHFLRQFKGIGGKGLSDVTASEMIYSLGRFINKKERKGAKVTYEKENI